MRVTVARAPRAGRRRNAVVAAVVLVLALIALGSWAVFYTDLLWYDEVGFSDVFWTEIRTKATLGAVFGAAFAALLLLNLWIVQKITTPRRLFTVPDEVLERYRATLQPYVRRLVVGAAVLFGVFAGSGATAQWRSWLLFRNGVSFGERDPVFDKDIAFYVFRLPFHRFLFTWGLSTLLVVTVVSGIAHYFMGGIRPQARGGDRVAPEVRAHLSVLLGLVVLLKGWGYRLDQFDLLYSSRGETVFGASYTDVNAHLPALTLMTIIALLVGVLFLVNVRIRAWILPLGGIALLALTSLFAGGIYPTAVQRLRVAPQERLREKEYIKRNIDATRAAFGLDGIEVRPFPARGSITRQDVATNRSTIENVRLWSPDVLGDAYRQLQRIRQYYEFTDVDVDRYSFGGERRQVMLSPREIHQAGLSAETRTWVNRHLVYTHGFGVVASRVDRATSEGQPSFIVQDVPPETVRGFPPITQPRVYYGESQEVPFVIVGTSEKELDYPREGQNFQESSYDGEGGIPLRGIVRRAAFAWRFRDPNVLISGSIKPESRILFRRDIRERVRRAAPFLRLDGDPYAVVTGGRVVWVQDAYTTTAMYPYSRRIDLSVSTDGKLAGVANYMRNSVKATVDAYDGTVRLYQFDDDDPIIRAWTKVFPGLVRPRSEMPRELREHLRYPEDLFKVQSERYTLYHMTEAVEFYSKEDEWSVPPDPTVDELTRAATPLPPYYVLMRLPGEKEESFVLFRPFTPRDRDNMVSWLAAKGDPDSYGKLVSYVFPKQRLVFGPTQVQSRINGDPEVSRQKTFWGQIKSRVQDGNLLVIPIGDSILYVQPLYVIGAGSQLPELRRVVVVSGEAVRMGETLDQAIEAVFTGRGAAPEREPEGESVADLIAEALSHYAAAQEALRAGDFAAYGREQDALRRALERASRASGASGASGSSDSSSGSSGSSGSSPAP